VVGLQRVSGVHTLSGLPNGEKLIDIPLVSENTTAAMNSPRPAGAEQHGPYQHGGIFPAVNSGGAFIPNPPLVVGGSTGPRRWADHAGLYI